MAFLAHECRVMALCPAGHPLHFVPGVDSLHPYESIDSIGSLESAIRATRPDLIVPCDDGVVWQLHELHRRDPGLRPLIERSIGSNGPTGSKDAYSQIRRRAAFLEKAAELGVRVPATKVLQAERDLDDWPNDAPAVVKADGTSGGNGVVIARSKAERVEAYGRLSQGMGFGMALKRLLINRDPLAIWSWRLGETPSVTVQSFIPGRPANTMMVCWQGEVLGMVSVEVLAARGDTGGATVVRLIENEEMEGAARRLARELGLSGFHGLDFVLEEATGAAYLIEINPRCTQLGHLRIPRQGDLAGMMAARLREEPAPVPRDCIQGSTVAFFPQAFKLNPKSCYLRCGYHDVPWEEPALVGELLRAEWPERQWLSRVYHRFRVPKQAFEAKF
jgi:hypothetical protein